MKTNKQSSRVEWILGEAKEQPFITATNNNRVVVIVASKNSVGDFFAGDVYEKSGEKYSKIDTFFALHLEHMKRWGEEKLFGKYDEKVASSIVDC